MSFNDAQEKTLDYYNEKIYYCTVGNPANDAIVFIHPAFCDHEIYEAQVEYFSKDYFTIFIDMVGHGKSQLKKLDINMSDMPEIISGVLNVEGKESAHLVGTSMGSLVSQGFAHQFPNMTKSITVVGGYSIHRDNEEIMKAQGKEMEKWLKKVLFDMKGLRQHIAETSVYTVHGREVFLKGAQQFKRRSFLTMNGMDSIFEKRESGVEYPLLIVCGEYDMDIIKRSSLIWAEAEENGTFVEIEDAGHCAGIDKPAKFNEIVGVFIRSCGV